MKGTKLEMVYQPIIDHQENKVIASEALCRPIQHGQAIRPDHWFRAAFEQGWSAEADVLALDVAMRNFVRSQKEVECADTMVLFVNVLPTSLMEPFFTDRIHSLLLDNLVPPHQLVLEIIEYVPYDPKALAVKLRPLRSLGVKIALDDIGVSCFDLQAISEIEPDYIKVDRSLIQGIASSESRQRCLTNLLRYVPSNKSVIAEGTEELQDIMTLSDIGIRLSQGYYWAKPMQLELANLHAKIQIGKHTLIQTWQQHGRCLTDEATLQVSQELDLLITKYTAARHLL